MVSLLLLGYKPVQHVTVLNTVDNCNTVVSIVILQYYGSTVVYTVRRWPKRRYAAHTCTPLSAIQLSLRNVSRNYGQLVNFGIHPKLNYVQIGPKIVKIFLPLLPLHVKYGCHCADCDVTKNYTTPLFGNLYRNGPLSTPTPPPPRWFKILKMLVEIKLRSWERCDRGWADVQKAHVD